MYSHRLFKSVLISLVILNPGWLSAKELKLVRTFHTWSGGIVMSTDPAGITFHQPSGHLFIADSEIDEISEIWDCANVFEISLAGDESFNTFDIYAPGGNPCPAHNKRELTGITYSAFDGFFYFTDDDNKVILRYSGNLEAPALAAVDIVADDSTARDPEGITCDPNTGNLYVVSGNDNNTVVQILVYNSDLQFITSYTVADRIVNPEGIAYNPVNNHLFLVSRREKEIFEYTLNGLYVDEYDISNFSPAPTRPQGLSFAPSSDPLDDPGNFHLYIVDTQLDNEANPNERDGIVYEAEIIESAAAVSQLILYPNFPNPFNASTTIKFQVSNSDNLTMPVDVTIYDSLGKVVRKLENRIISGGTYELNWDGMNDDGRPQSSGIYFVHISVNNFNKSQKIVLLR